MLKDTIIFLTVLTYGTNLIIYLFLKFGKKERSLMEKASMLLAINMTLLMVDGIIAICAKLIADSVFTAGLVELEQDFCIFS